MTSESNKTVSQTPRSLKMLEQKLAKSNKQANAINLDVPKEVSLTKSNENEIRSNKSCSVINVS